MGTEYQYDTIIVEKPEPRIGILWFNRPEKRNSISPDLCIDMNDVLPRIADDDEIRVLIVSGKGAAFCAGMDLATMLKNQRGEGPAKPDPRTSAPDWWQKLRELPKPTIAAMNGHAYGGGLLTIGCCDLAVADEDARGGLSEINWGTPPGGGATRAALYNLLPKQYNYLLYTGNSVSGRDLERMGYVNAAVPAAELMPHALELARQVVKHHPTALKYLKRQVRISESLIDYYMGVEAEGNVLSAMRGAGYTGSQDGLQDFVDKKYRPGIEAKDYE